MGANAKAFCPHRISAIPALAAMTVDPPLQEQSNRPRFTRQEPASLMGRAARINPQQVHFSPRLQAHGPAMGHKVGTKTGRSDRFAAVLRVRQAPGSFFGSFVSGDHAANIARQGKIPGTWMVWGKNHAPHGCSNARMKAAVTKRPRLPAPPALQPLTVFQTAAPVVCRSDTAHTPARHCAPTESARR